MAGTVRQTILKGSTAEWESYNPVLLNGEMGYELKEDGNWACKIGDGQKRWTQLDYFLNQYVTAEEMERISKEASTMVKEVQDLVNTIPSDYTALSNQVSSLSGEIGYEAITVISCKTDFIESDSQSNMANDWIYVLGDLTRGRGGKTKRFILDIYSNGGSGTIYVLGNGSVIRFKNTYSFTAGMNRVSIDVSSYSDDYLSLAIYSNDVGAFTYQSGANNLNPNAVAMTYYIATNQWTKNVGDFFTGMIYWGGNVKTNKSYPTITVYHEEQTYKNAVGTIHVGKESIYEYHSIMDAIRNSGDQTIPLHLIIHEGIYDEVIYLGNKHDGITIEGVSENDCIIRNNSGIYGNSPLVIAGNFTIKNLTFQMLTGEGFVPTYGDNVYITYPGYALHIDGDSIDRTKPASALIKNCVCYSEAFPAVGMGVNQNQTITFEDCTFYRQCSDDRFKQNNWQGAFVGHSSNIPNSVNQVLRIYNCIFKSNYGTSGNLRANLQNSENFTLDAINNVFVSMENGAGSFTYDKGNSVLAWSSCNNNASNLNYNS